MMQNRVTKKEEGLRLDKYLVEKLGISRNIVKDLLDGGRIKVNGRRVVIAKWEMVEGDNIEINGDIKKEMRGAKGHQKLRSKSEKVFINILFEDRDILVVDKPAGVVVQAGPNSYGEKTYVDHLRDYLKRKHGGRGSFIRPVHRLDKDTSGLMVFYKSKVGERLITQFKQHTVTRSYLAIVEKGISKESGVVEYEIQKGDFGHGKKVGICRKGGEGQKAVTHFCVIERYKSATLVRLDLMTGRTHQARIHMAAINHPIVGDKIYGVPSKIAFPRQALHSYKLHFKHPATGNPMKFKIELPEDMTALVDDLRENDAL